MQLIGQGQRRGAEVFALELSRVLEEQGHSTRVVTLYGSADGALELRPVDSTLGGDVHHPAERIPGFHPGLLRRLLAAIDDFEPHVVQLNGSRTVKYGSLARRLRPRAPWVLVYRNIGMPSDWLGGRIRRFLYRHLVISTMDAVAAVSRRTLEGLEQTYQLQVPAAVLPGGVDVERFGVPAAAPDLPTHATGSPDSPVILYVGSLTTEKRPDRLLRVAAAAADEWAAEVGADGEAAVDLWVVGDGPLRKVLERADQPHLRIHLAGVQRDVAPWLHGADLLLLPSDTEGTPGVVLEAAAAGLPTVATRVGGVAECVEHGTTGLLADMEDESALAKAVAGLLSEPTRRRRMGEAARQMAESSFSLSRLAQRYVSHYRTALALRAERLDGNGSR